jgi:DNA glycosylase AlkZ-like
MSSAELTLAARVDGLGPDDLGLLCFAPSQGQQVRFTRPDTWLDGCRARPRQGHGRGHPPLPGRLRPGDPGGLRPLMGHPQPGPGAPAAGAPGDEVAKVEVEGTAAYALAADLPGLAEAGAGGSRVVRLLPAFDQYVITATLQAERLMPGPFKDRVYRPQGWLSPVLLVGGRMDGTWRQERKGRRLLVVIEPFAGPLSAWARRAAEAERLAAFADGELELSWADA